MPRAALGSALACWPRTRPSARHCAFSWLSCPPRMFGRETVNVFEIGGTRGARVSSRSSPFSAPQRAGPARPVHGLPVPVMLLRRRLPTLAAVRAPGYEPYDDKDGHRDQPDDDKRLERGEDPACGRDGKSDGKDRAEDCPDDSAHIPIMRRRSWQAAVMPVASAADPFPRQGSRAWRSPPVRADIRDRRPGPRVSRTVTSCAPEPPFGADHGSVADAARAARNRLFCPFLDTCQARPGDPTKRPVFPGACEAACWPRQAQVWPGCPAQAACWPGSLAGAGLRAGGWRGSGRSSAGGGRRAATPTPSAGPGPALTAAPRSPPRPAHPWPSPAAKSG